MTYEALLEHLQIAYDRAADEREERDVQAWKQAERRQFLVRLQADAARSLLDIGAGAGAHGKFFQESGLSVTCTDLSPALVEGCRRKGLTAHVMDFLHLDFPEGAFDAPYAMNCLLHVPRADLGRVLAAVSRPLRPGGLFYWGQYGGRDEEGVYEGDHYSPKRFFSRLRNETMVKAASDLFEVVDFHTVALDDDVDFFQSLTLRRPTVS